MKKDTPSPLTPPDLNVPVIKPIKKVAGGIPAIASSMKHAVYEAGTIRGARLLLKVNQTSGFDCPGCAWPDPDERSFTEFCENGAKAVAEEATTNLVTPDFFKAHSLAELAERSDYHIGKLGRLTHPMIKKPGGTHYEPITWDDAFALIARHLHSLQSPHQATFYTSGRTSNEAAFLYQLFVRMFGTNNLPDCSNMCHESSGVALVESIGVGKGSVTLGDFDHADCILVFGQNPGTNHPRMLTTLQKAARRGCKIISINPLPEAGLNRFIHPQEFTRWMGGGTKLATLHVPVRINGDMALLKGIMKDLLEAEKCHPGCVFDHDFIATHTHGYADFIADLETVSWEVIVSASGISREVIGEVTKILMSAKAVIACWAMGLTQHKNGVATIQEVVNLLLLGGHLGRKGAGVCPVRGHSNVQGDRTMGIYEKMPDDFLDRLGAEFNFDPPRAHGLDTVDSIRAMHEGRVRVFLAMGGNFLSATPDTDFVAQALGKCDLTVHIATKLNRAHLITGACALILPCLGRTEHDVQAHGPQSITVENSMGIVHASRGTLSPCSRHLKSEAAIVAGLATAVLPKKSIDWAWLLEDYARIREHISRVVLGFENFNEKIKNPQGFYVPHAVRDNKTFNTPTGKAQFSLNPLSPVELEPNRFLMMTIRTHDQFNTTIYGLEDRYRGIFHNRRVILMNGQDIKQLQLSAGDKVDVVSYFAGETRRAPDFTVVEYPIPRGCTATYFPEANVLVPLGSTADKSNTPTYKSVVIGIEASALP